MRHWSVWDMYFLLQCQRQTSNLSDSTTSGNNWLLQLVFLVRWNWARWWCQLVLHTHSAIPAVWMQCLVHLYYCVKINNNINKIIILPWNFINLWGYIVPWTSTTLWEYNLWSSFFSLDLTATKDVWTTAQNRSQLVFSSVRVLTNIPADVEGSGSFWWEWRRGGQGVVWRISPSWQFFNTFYVFFMFSFPFNISQGTSQP